MKESCDRGHVLCDSFQRNQVMSFDINGLCQISFGEPVDMLGNAITPGLLSESFVNNRQMRNLLKRNLLKNMLRVFFAVLLLDLLQIDHLAIDFSEEKFASECSLTIDRVVSQPLLRR